MSIKVTKARNGGRKLLFDDSLTIYNAVESKKKIIDSIEKYDCIDLDLSDVEEIDTAGLQLILLAVKTAAEEGRPIRKITHSPATFELVNTLNLLGLLSSEPTLTIENWNL